MESSKDTSQLDSWLRYQIHCHKRGSLTIMQVFFFLSPHAALRSNAGEIIARKIITFLSFTQHFLTRDRFCTCLGPPGKLKSVKLITSVQCISRSDPSNTAAEGSPDGATPCPLTPTSSLILSRVGDSGVPPPPLTYSRAFTNKGVPLNFEITMQPPIPRDAFKGFPPDLLDNIEASFHLQTSVELDGGSPLPPPPWWISSENEQALPPTQNTHHIHFLFHTLPSIEGFLPSQCSQELT